MGGVYKMRTSFYCARATQHRAQTINHDTREKKMANKQQMEDSQMKPNEIVDKMSEIENEKK